VADCTFESKTVKTRKPHRCIGCWAPIAVGEECHYWSGVFDGELGSNHMHKECEAGWDGEDFTPGDFPVPQRVREQFSTH